MGRGEMEGGKKEEREREEKKGKRKYVEAEIKK